MTRILNTLVLSAAVAAATFAAVPAGAADRWHSGDRPVMRQADGAALLAAGIIGLAAGVIVAGIVGDGQQPAQAGANPYRHPRPQPDRDYFPPAPQAGWVDGANGPRRVAPRSREWHRACVVRYRGAHAQAGGYGARNGGRQFCAVD